MHARKAKRAWCVPSQGLPGPVSFKPLRLQTPNELLLPSAAHTHSLPRAAAPGDGIVLHPLFLSPSGGRSELPGGGVPLHTLRGVRRQLLLSSPGSVRSSCSEDADDHLGAFDLPQREPARPASSSWAWAPAAGAPKAPSHVTPTSILDLHVLGSYSHLSPASSSGDLYDIPLTHSSARGGSRVFGASDVHRAAMAAASETEQKNAAASRGCSLFGGCAPVAAATPDPAVRHLRFLSQPPAGLPPRAAPSTGKPPRSSRLCSLL